MSTLGLNNVLGKRKRSVAKEEQPPSSSTSIGIQIPSNVGAQTLDDLPAETIETVLSYLDGHSLAIARRVCRKWHRLIDAAPWDALQKVAYRSLTVTAQRGLEIILEKFADEAMPGDEEEAEPSPKKPRLTEDQATGTEWEEEERLIRKQKRASLSRSKSGATLKITDRLSAPEMPHLMKYFRHISADKLVLQSLSGKGLMTMLLIFKRMCLRTRTLVLDFCNFNGIKKQMLFDFLKPRRGRLQEVQLSSCRDMGTSFSPVEFWEGLGALSGPFPTIRLKDHYSNSPWMDELATMVLGLKNPPWMLDIDGVSPPQEAVHERLLNWYAEDPTLGPVLREAARQREEGERGPASLHSSPAHTPSSIPRSLSAAHIPHTSAYRSAGVQAGSSSSVDVSYSPLREEPTVGSRRNFIIKIDNCRGIRLGRFWNETQRQVLEPNGIRLQPELCKVLEQCFDGRSRYSTHRNRMVLKRPDGARFAIYLQR